MNQSTPPAPTIEAEAFEFSQTCLEVPAYAVSPTPGYSLFTHIVIGKSHYSDIGAACSCKSMRLLRYGDMAYSVCKDHGTQALGSFRRDVDGNGRPA